MTLFFLDPVLHKNLMYLKTCEDVEDLALNFTLMENDFGQSQIIELIPGGQNIPVTNENKIRYIATMANYKLNVQIKHQSAAFLRGFSQIISPEVLRMFNQHELQTIISGNPGGIDISDMRSHTQYTGGYHDEHPVVDRFWKVVASFAPEQQRKLLMFITSCSRPPLLGFVNLHPNFCIARANPNTDNIDAWLPTSSTCMNLLKLPPYSSEEKMKERISYAINAKAGFELS